MKKYIFPVLLFITIQTHAQPYSQQMAATAMKLWPDSFSNKGQPARWSYDQGVILKGIEGIWYATGEGKWFTYIQKSMDHFVQEDGSIKGYKSEDFNIDNVNNGKALLLLYQVTQKEKYYKAVNLLRNQLLNHPRTSEGSFWHKKVYPFQVWLDGLYMAQPFYAEYAKVMGEDTIFNDIARQFVLIEKHARDKKTGLLYHGWDESRDQQWADKKTGLSPNVWARALGWYGMAMVDALDHFPKTHPGREQIIEILKRFAVAVSKVQDAKTGLWYDVVNLPREPKNYFEASASCMLVYTLAKGVRLGYLPSTFLKNAKKGYDGIIKIFIKKEDGQLNLHGTVSVSGLGGKPYRDGSFAYYMSEPVVVNDAKGVGAFINASVEMELVPKLTAAKGKRVLLDNHFNNEWRKDPLTGKMAPFHYIFDDLANSGYSMFGRIFNNFGFTTATLKEEVSADKLKNAEVYVIVDPDWSREAENPQFIEARHIEAIYNWVKKGGVLLMFSNDTLNVEFDHFNKLAGRFGMHFNQNSLNTVEGNKFIQGTVPVPPAHPIFKTAKNLYLKEVGSITIKFPAISALNHKGAVFMASARVGKGLVFAVGDPWIYNEYVDGRKLPPNLDNYKGAEDLVKWIATQLSNKH